MFCDEMYVLELLFKVLSWLDDKFEVLYVVLSVLDTLLLTVNFLVEVILLVN